MPVAGTPVIPPSYLTFYFLIFFGFLVILYIYFYKRKQPLLFWGKVKLLVVLALVIKLTLISGVATLAAYWLVPSPRISRSTPKVNEQSFSPTDKIEIVFDRPLSRAALEKAIYPETPGVWMFENSIYTTHLYRKLVFYPTNSLRPDTEYSINLKGIQNLSKFSKPYDYQFNFKTQASPKIVSVQPVSGEREVDVNSGFKVTLDNPNDNVSDFEFQFSPKVDFQVALDATKMVYTITPNSSLKENVEYNLKIRKSNVILNLEDKTVIERDDSSIVYDGNFTTKSGQNIDAKNIILREPIKVTSITPQNGWSAVSVNSKVKITFDHAVDKTSAEEKFSITPKVDGSFSWEGDTLVFSPAKPFENTTLYTVNIDSGVRAVSGLSSLETYKAEFSTQNFVTKLSVPAFLQKYTLSCEIAALRMALNFKGVNVSEDDIIPRVGFDTTPHSGDTWGDPNKAFVGNIKGTQMKDGYGVHWAPIAKAARTYRDAKDFQGWSIQQLTSEISKGNPVVIWVYSHFGTKTLWKTPDGNSVYAVRDEHAVTVVGFVGPADNPTQMIINDPLSGQVYWSRSAFDRKWDIFGRSGVVVY